MIKFSRSHTGPKATNPSSSSASHSSLTLIIFIQQSYCYSMPFVHPAWTFQPQKESIHNAAIPCTLVSCAPQCGLLHTPLGTIEDDRLLFLDDLFSSPPNQQFQSLPPCFQKLPETALINCIHASRSAGWSPRRLRLRCKYVLRNAWLAKRTGSSSPMVSCHTGSSACSISSYVLGENFAQLCAQLAPLLYIVTDIS